MIKFLSGTTCVVLAAGLLAGTPAAAASVDNGVSENGRNLNGRNLNGRNLNGVEREGTSLIGSYRIRRVILADGQTVSFD